MKLLFGKYGHKKVCVEWSNEPRLWLFDKDFSSYTVYMTDSLVVDGNRIRMEAQKYFRVTFWEDIAERPDKRAVKLFRTCPDDLPELDISVCSRDKIWI